MKTINIDDDYKSLLPELTAEEYSGLEEDIVKRGILDPIILWDGTIVDGHNRYEIAMVHQFPDTAIPTRDISFESKSQAMEWIINHQKSRRNLTKSQMVIAWGAYEKELAEEAKARQLASQNNNAGKAVSSNLNEQRKPIRTAKEVAKKIGVSENTYRDMKYIMNHGTEEQIKRMDKGGHGNGASAIATEIRTKDKPNKVCRICGQEYPAIYFGERNVCKYCCTEQKHKKENGVLRDVKGDVIASTGEYDGIDDAEIIGNLYINDVADNISITDVVEEFNVNFETSLATLERIMNTHSDLLAVHKSEVSAMWSKAIDKLNQMKERYV